MNIIKIQINKIYYKMQAKQILFIEKQSPYKYKTKEYKKIPKKIHL